jgi:tetratricopeptide (TPR) repeat protein
MVLATAAAVPSVAVACLWDYDTIKMERDRFPNTLELITGKFLRHSPEFYEWRIRDRLKKLEFDPTNDGYLDDLAVAYDKTGQNQKAIETMLRKEQLHPGLYETAANLSAFYFHAGQLETSLAHVNRALAINPDAHFGREKYQKSLTEYVISRRANGSLKLPLANGPSHGRDSFSDFLTQQLRDRDPTSSLNPQLPAAIKAVLGMMRFANFESPILLEALGNLLTGYDTHPEIDAKLLAARAYLKASYEVPDGPQRHGYRKMAEDALSMQILRRDQKEQITLEQVEAEFQKELEEGRSWYAELHEKELSWIRDGKNPETEFDKLFDHEPEVSGMDTKHRMSAYQWMAIVTGLLAAGTILIFLGTFARRRVSRALR